MHALDRTLAIELLSESAGETSFPPSCGATPEQRRRLIEKLECLGYVETRREQSDRPGHPDELVLTGITPHGELELALLRALEQRRRSRSRLRGADRTIEQHLGPRERNP